MTISPVSSSAFYVEPISVFLDQSNEHIRGVLSGQSPFADTPDQKDAWTGEIAILKTALRGIGGYLCMEFDVPRVGSRVDAIVLSGGCIFVLEFKVGESSFHREAINQVWDYALGNLWIAGVFSKAITSGRKIAI